MAADHWDMGQNGVVDISWGTHNYTSGRFPLTSAMDLPFLTNSAKGGSRALHEFYLKHLQKEHEKVKVLWLQCPAPFHLHMTKKAALTPADLAGVHTGGSKWHPSLPGLVLADLLTLLDKNGELAVAFRFRPVGLGAKWQIDDVYVDPFRNR